MVHNLLVADDIALFRAVGTDLAVEPWATLLGDIVDVSIASARGPR